MEKHSFLIVHRQLTLAQSVARLTQRVKGAKFDTWSGHILSFLFLLNQEGYLSTTDESLCTKYWLTV